VAAPAADPISTLPISTLPISTLPISTLPISTLPISTLPISTLPTSTSSTSSTGSSIQTVYAPPQYYGGDYGHRYYGRYHDSGCGCDRYASPNYAPQTVVATQVESVPKGGVNTGDGSFQ